MAMPKIVDCSPTMKISNKVNTAAVMIETFFHLDFLRGENMKVRYSVNLFLKQQIRSKPKKIACIWVQIISFLYIYRYPLSIKTFEVSVPPMMVIARGSCGNELNTFSAVQSSSNLFDTIQFNGSSSLKLIPPENLLYNCR